MFHLLILAIIKPLYIDIQVFVYFNNSKTIIFGKTSFYAGNYSYPRDDVLG